MQIVVLGPHRSGTSLVTRLINLMGPYVGDDGDAIDAADDNPKGFWERKDVVAVNDAILEHFNCSWDSLAGWSINTPREPIPAAIGEDLAAAVRRLDAHPSWVIKDPRLCLTWPFWLPHLSRPVRVIVSRDPGEVSVSLARRNNMSLAHALAIWEYSAVGILAGHPDRGMPPTAYVSYDAFLKSPAEAISRLRNELSRLGGPGLSMPEPAAVEAFVDRGLHRSRAGAEFNRALLTPHHDALFAALSGRGGHAGATTVSPLARTTMEAYRDLFPQRIASAVVEKTLADLRTARDQARAEAIGYREDRDAVVADLVALRRSWSWRLTSPFRFVRYVFVGNVTKVRFIVSLNAARVYRWLPARVRGWLDLGLARAGSLTGLQPESTANFGAIADLVDARCRKTADPFARDPQTAALPPDPPAVDISAVTFNNGTWITPFVESVVSLRYPKSRLTIRFVDNSSTDDTPRALEIAVETLRAAGLTAEWMSRPNKGYGAGHNAAIAGGTAPYCLVTNVDLQFDPDALARVVATAAADSGAAAWELRQKPYEHPKYYDPVTGTTNWNSHACVLLDRTAIRAAGGYDETLFMYGEDVELSYRLRRAGFELRYCPSALVYHHSYESPAAVKPAQYAGSTFANLYLRLKFGRPTDVLAVPWMAARLVTARQPYPGARGAIMRNLGRLVTVLPRVLVGRRRSKARFPFRVWDYDLTRDGAFVAVDPLPAEPPPVTVVTRTYRGREQLLRQCLLSVAHQTYPNIEHLVVEDGGTSAASIVEEIGRATSRPARFIGLNKVGRSAAGNRGLEEAKGHWCLFLDDDDLLFADHVEVLAGALLKDAGAVAAYALAWEVTTDPCEAGYVEQSHVIPGFLRQPFDYSVLRHHNFMAIQAVLFERRLFLERGGFDEDMEILEDWMLWIRYAHNGRFAYVPKVTSMFRTPAERARVDQRMEAFNAAYPLAVARVQARIRALEAGTAR